MGSIEKGQGSFDLGLEGPENFFVNPETGEVEEEIPYAVRKQQEELRREHAREEIEKIRASLKGKGRNPNA